MAAIAYPPLDTPSTPAANYLVTPWTAPDGSQWLYKEKGRWMKSIAIDTPPGGGDVAGDTVAAESKTTPVDADLIPLVDSAAANVLKKLTWANLKAALKAFLTPAEIGAAATSHVHGAINNAGEIGTTANLPIFTGVQGQLNAISSLSTARTNLGATTVGGSLFTLANPGAITFPRINADNTVTALSAANFNTALGLGTGDRPTFNGIICGAGFYVAASNGIAVLVNSSLTGTTTCGGWFQLKAGSATEGLYFGSGHLIRWGSSSTNTSAAGDVGVGRNAAGVAEINSGTSGAFRDLKLRNLVTTDYLEGAEMTAPAAPAANRYRIFAEDDGAGKTRLMVVFATGAAQQIAIEP